MLSRRKSAGFSLLKLYITEGSERKYEMEMYPFAHLSFNANFQAHTAAAPADSARAQRDSFYPENKAELHCL